METTFYQIILSNLSQLSLMEIRALQIAFTERLCIDGETMQSQIIKIVKQNCSRKLQAVKEIKQLTGLGLKESKQIADDIWYSLGWSYEKFRIVEQEVNICNGEKLKAIKAIKLKNDWGLKETKDIFDHFYDIYLKIREEEGKGEYICII